MEVSQKYEDGCVTPKHPEHQIPAPSVCPPAPKKKSPRGRIQYPSNNGFFQPPDLEALFAASLFAS
ncbi:hypothetical protein CJ030_MR2G023238 [Morella rubra]|uniref:Cyclin-dependent protein kinase inhibitor SMR4 n=1 Tax=Morella rubra TaxID=262757 RepID=A0A6A1WK94_9ROSI|nr:hypothetical protein CJ030_MR2G023238 [Morella rubra]